MGWDVLGTSPRAFPPFLLSRRSSGCTCFPLVRCWVSSRASPGPCSCRAGIRFSRCCPVWHGCRAAWDAWIIARLPCRCQAISCKIFRFGILHGCCAVFLCGLHGCRAGSLDFCPPGWYPMGGGPARRRTHRAGPGWKRRVSLAGGTRRFSYLLALCRSSSALRKSSMVLAFSAIAMISNRSALLASFTSSSPVLGVFTFPPSLLDALRRFAGPGPCGLGLSRMIADGFSAVNPPKTVPHVPPLGGLGNYFCTKFRGCFLVKMAKAGIPRRGRLQPIGRHKANNRQPTSRRKQQPTGQGPADHRAGAKPPANSPTAQATAHSQQRTARRPERRQTGAATSKRPRPLPTKRARARVGTPGAFVKSAGAEAQNFFRCEGKFFTSPGAGRKNERGSKNEEGGIRGRRILNFCE